MFATTRRLVYCPQSIGAISMQVGFFYIAVTTIPIRRNYENGTFEILLRGMSKRFFDVRHSVCFISVLFHDVANDRSPMCRCAKQVTIRWVEIRRSCGRNCNNDGRSAKTQMALLATWTQCVPVTRGRLTFCTDRRRLTHRISGAAMTVKDYIHTGLR